MNLCLFKISLINEGSTLISYLPFPFPILLKSNSTCNYWKNSILLDRSSIHDTDPLIFFGTSNNPRLLHHFLSNIQVLGTFVPSRISDTTSFNSIYILRIFLCILHMPGSFKNTRSRKSRFWTLFLLAHISWIVKNWKETWKARWGVFFYSFANFLWETGRHSACRENRVAMFARLFGKQIGSIEKAQQTNFERNFGAFLMLADYSLVNQPNYVRWEKHLTPTGVHSAFRPQPTERREENLFSCV